MMSKKSKWSWMSFSDSDLFLNLDDARRIEFGEEKAKIIWKDDSSTTIITDVDDFLKHCKERLLDD